MRWDSVRGQDAAVAFLRAALSSGRLPNAALLWGPVGVGKRTAGRTLAAAALCAEGAAGRDEACGSCAHCREFAAGVHPDYLELQVEDEARSIKIEDARTLMREMNMRPARGVMRVALIAKAERLGEEAQNALLKSLEEPPGRALWILTSEEPDRLLGTVRSRASHVRLNRLASDVVAGELVRAGESDAPTARRVAALAEGSVTLARRLNTEEYTAELTFIEASVLPAVGAGVSAGPELARALAKHAGAKGAARKRKAEGGKRSASLEETRRPVLRLLDALAQTMRRRVKSSANNRTDADFWARKLQVVLDSDTAIRHNVRPELVLTAAAARLADAADS